MDTFEYFMGLVIVNILVFIIGAIVIIVASDKRRNEIVGISYLVIAVFMWSSLLLSIVGTKKEDPYMSKPIVLNKANIYTDQNAPK